MPLVPFLVSPWVSNFLMILLFIEKFGWVVEIIHCSLIVFYLHNTKKATTLEWSGTTLLYKYFFGWVSLHIDILYVHPFFQRLYACNPTPFPLCVIIFLSSWWNLKCMEISSMEKATPIIQMSGNINNINVRIYCILQIWILFLVHVWSGGFSKQRMLFKFLWRRFNFAQINCRWNNCHLPCPLAVD